MRIERRLVSRALSACSVERGAAKPPLTWTTHLRPQAAARLRGMICRSLPESSSTNRIAYRPALADSLCRPRAQQRRTLSELQSGLRAASASITSLLPNVTSARVMRARIAADMRGGDDQAACCGPRADLDDPCELAGDGLRDGHLPDWSAV